MESELTILISKAMGSMLTILILEARVLSELAILISEAMGSMLTILILEAMRSKLKSSQLMPREADVSYPTLSLLTFLFLLEGGHWFRLLLPPVLHPCLEARLSSKLPILISEAM